MKKNRAEKELCIKTTKAQKSIEKGNSIRDFISTMKADEKIRKESNKRFISNLENDLEYYDRAIVEMKTVKRGKELRDLILTRLNITNKIQDSISDEEYKNLISEIQLLKDRVDSKIDRLADEPDDEPIEDTPLKRLEEIPELNTPEAKAIFDRAIEANLIKVENGLLRWNKEDLRCTKVLLAYFCEKMSNELELSNRLDKNGNKTVSWKPFEKLFNEKNIKGAKYGWMLRSTETFFFPIGANYVDEIC